MKKILIRKSKLVCLVIVLIALFFSFQTMAFASEAERNKKIADGCQRKAKQDSVGDGQTKPLCQQAIYYKCLAEKLCDDYPAQCESLKSNANKVCEILSNMDAECPACD